MSNQQAVVKLLSAKLGSLVVVLSACKAHGSPDHHLAQLEILDQYMPALAAANREMDALLDELNQLHESRAY